MVIQKSESVMNGFFQAFRMEVLRAIQNSFFPTTYFAILITLFLNIYLYTTTDSYVSVAYLLEYSFIGSLTMLFYVWGVLPHGLSYCVDEVVFCDKLGIDALSGITALQNAVRLF